jgi:hypothetical protein
MSLVAVFVVIGIVVAVAAVLVIREAGRIGRHPPPALFVLEDAYAWIVDHLPDEVAATLTTDDVERILELQTEFLERPTPPVTNGNGPTTGGPIIVGGTEQVDYIVRRAGEDGEAYIPEQVQGVLDTQLAYLRFIGAVGPRADDDLGPGSDLGAGA